MKTDQENQYLYHGSPYKVDLLEPVQAADWLNPASNNFGVYATDLKDIALAFCLGGVPNENGDLSRIKERLPNGQIKMIFLEGIPNINGKGYLYTLSKDGFEQVCANQFVSRQQVTPLKVEEVLVADLKHLWRLGTAEEIQKAKDARI